MQQLRTARFFGCNLARLVLAWFVLSVGVAVAAPLVNPKAMELVCSGAGMVKLVVSNDDGPASAGSLLGSGGADCALCGATAAPPAVLTGLQVPPSPLAHALRPVVGAALAALTAAPLPARGPPFFS